MRYMFLIYDDEDAFAAKPQSAQMEVIGEFMVYTDTLKKAGAYISGAPLEHSRVGRRIIGERIDNGPFADAKEQLGGYYMVEAKDLDEALDWAARCPGASYGRIEVRPVWEVEN